MPHKHNESHRHKIKKARYQVSNWRDYNNALRQRVDFMIWFTEEAIADWHPVKNGVRGRPLKYSAIAIETALLIRQVFHQPLRQTEGLMKSLTRALNAPIAIPDFSCISKRSTSLPQQVLAKAMKPGSLVIVDSTGLKVYGKDEWHQEKHDAPARRTWRKLHLAIDENHQVLACELTTPDVGYPSTVPDLLDQIDSDFDTFMGDGTYDGEPVSHAVLSQQPDAKVIVPPHKTGVCSPADNTQLDQHIREIEQQRRMTWQNETGYGFRNYVELAMQRYKRIFGNTMKARLLPQQKAEAWASAGVLNRMTGLRHTCVC